MDKHLQGLDAMDPLHAMDAAASRTALAAVVVIAGAEVFRGIDWVATHWLPYLLAASQAALALAMLLLPVTLLARARAHVGGAIVTMSYVFGVTEWLASCSVTWSLGGGWAFALGIALFGWGVIPLALLITVCKGMWPDFWLIAGLLSAMLAASLGGGAIARAHPATGPRRFA